MKPCPSCGRHLADFVEVCPYCAAPAPPAAGRSFPQAMLGRGAPAGGPPENSGKALASLICGVVFFLWPLSAIAAVVLGHVALGEIGNPAFLTDESLVIRSSAHGGADLHSQPLQ